MSLLSGLSSNAGIEEQQDVIMSRGPLESGLYDMAIDVAYLEKSAGGALCVKINYVDKMGRKLNDVQWITSGDAKGNKNYYEKDGKKYFLPGFNIINSICVLTVDKEIGELQTESRQLEVWDWSQRKNVLQPKDVLVELVGQQITLGVVKQVVDKQKRNPDTGKYENTGDTKTENIISKAFRISDGKTVAEIKAQSAEASFKAEWANTFTGITPNKASKSAKEIEKANNADAEAVKAMFP